MHRSFDILVSDLGLPDGSGVDLIRRARTQGFAAPAGIVDEKRDPA